MLTTLSVAQNMIGLEYASRSGPWLLAAIMIRIQISLKTSAFLTIERKIVHFVVPGTIAGLQTFVIWFLAARFIVSKSLSNHSANWCLSRSSLIFQLFWLLKEIGAAEAIIMKFIYSVTRRMFINCSILGSNLDNWGICAPHQVYRCGGSPHNLLGDQKDMSVIKLLARIHMHGHCLPGEDSVKPGTWSRHFNPLAYAAGSHVCECFALMRSIRESLFIILTGPSGSEPSTSMKSPTKTLSYPWEVHSFK